MKILHICCNLAGSTVFPQLFEALRDQGVRQEVFVPEKRPEDMNRNIPQGVATHYALTVKKTDALFFFRKAQRSVPEIEKRVDLKSVSLIYAHTLFTDGSIARALSKKTGLPYMVTLRWSDTETIWKYEPHLRPMGRDILRKASRIVFLNEACRQRVLSEWFGEGERPRIAAKTAVIPNGIKPEWLTGMARSALGDTVRVGFAGVLQNRKRPLDVLAAVHAADDAKTGRRFVLHACGKGPLEEELKAGLRKDDVFEGRVQGMESMKRFYESCDVLLVPSSAETFGMVYLEAMSQGVPVLYTRGQGFDGQFPEGEIGFSVACGDVKEQKKRLEEICEGYAQRSERCIRHAADYAWPNVARRWIALYEMK